MRSLEVSLARLCHGDVKISEDTIAKSLEGDYRPEHLFALRHSLTALHYYQQLIVDVDQEIQRQLGSLGTATTAEPTVRVDLTNVPGIRAITAQTILCEIGTDVSRFRYASPFASYSVPGNKISGGKMLYTKSRRVKSRVATALSMAANSLHHANNYLGEILSVYHSEAKSPPRLKNLARIVYHLLNTREAYNEIFFHRCDEEALKRAQYRLRKQAAQLGFQIIPLQNG